jgi:iron complex outermembrane receptor protein
MSFVSKLQVSAIALAIGQLAAMTPARAADSAAATDAAFAAAAATEAASSDEAAAEAEATPEIIVSATKRDTNLQDTPIAITVVDDQLIRDRHVQSLLDLGDGGVPSLRVATFEARQSALTIGIRGIVPFDQNQTAREPGVGVYVDGVYLGRTQGLNAALFDVQRIEVLRGPQGTLFGRNTEGGALSVVTAAPTGEFGGRASGGVGNYGSYTGEVHLNMPEFANISLKFDGVIQHQGATTENPADGQFGWNYYNRVGGRVAARWRPVDELTVDLAYDQAKDENTPFYSQLIDFNPLGMNVGTYTNPVTGAVGTTLFSNGSACNSTTNKCVAPLAPLVQVSGDRRMDVADMGVIQQPSVDTTHGFSSNIAFRASPDVTLRSITAWRGVSTHQWDGSAGAHRSAFVPNGQFGRYSLSELFQDQFSQELQVVGSLQQVDFVLGAYYFNEHAEEAAATPNPEQWNANGTGYTFVNQVPANPTGAITSSNQGWQRQYWFVQRHSTARAQSYAAFGQATWTPPGADAFHLTLGGRYTHDKRTGALDVISMVATPYTFNYSNSRFDPLAIAAFDVTPEINLYAKYATGFRAGGANDRSATFRSFGPESVRSFEVGAKTEFWNRRVRFNVAAYLMDRTGTQIDFDFVDTTAILPSGAANPNFNKHTEETVNVTGKSRIKGVELELTVRAVEGLTLSANYTYTDVKVPPVANPIAASPATFGVITQVYTVFTPKNAASGAIDYEVPLPTLGGDTRLRFHLDGNYADPQYSFQAESVLTQKSFVVNGRIALADIPLTANGTTATIGLWSRNLLDEEHIYRRSNANAVVIGDYGNFNPPRTFGIDATVSF